MANTINNISARDVFNNSAQLLYTKGIDVASAKLTQSYLRAEVLCTTTATEYTLPFIVNNSDPTNFNTQQKLNLQDAFVASELGIFVAKPASSSDTKFELLTYPDPVTFNGSGVAAALYSLYNGKVSVTVNNDVIVPAWDIARCYSVPMQQSVANADYTSSLIAYKNSTDLATSGFYPVEPNIIVNGAGNFQFKIQLPAAFAAVEATQRIVVIMRGVLAQNITSVR